jgi:hypothetical protein
MECLVFSLRKKTLRENTRPYRYHGLKIFTSLKLRFQDFQRGFPFEIYKLLLYATQHALLGEPTEEGIILLANNKFFAYFIILRHSLDGIVDEMLQEYDRQCSSSICPVTYDASLDNDGDRFFAVGNEGSGEYAECMYRASNNELISHKTCSGSECVYQNFYKSGELGETTFLLDSLLHGNSIEFYESGQIWEKSTFFQGELNGTKTVYRENGDLYTISNYSNGVLDGIRQTYSEGKLVACLIYDVTIQLIFLTSIMDRFFSPSS